MQSSKEPNAPTIDRKLRIIIAVTGSITAQEVVACTAELLCAVYLCSVKVIRYALDRLREGDDFAFGCNIEASYLAFQDGKEALFS